METTDAANLLQVLERDFPNSPPVARKGDLAEINAVRRSMGKPEVAAEDLLPRPKAVVRKTAPKPVRDHSAARAVYQTYLRRAAELEPHRRYADAVARATGGPGQTPVMPLATMGCGGGPLLCDHCGNPMILEGGRWDRIYADKAWASSGKDPAWKSWIKGGMVVEVVGNGTLRIYHGYPGRTEGCCNEALAQRHRAEAAHGPTLTDEVRTALYHFLADEFPLWTDRERADLFGEVAGAVFDYDPGIGVNRPC